MHLVNLDSPSVSLLRTVHGVAGNSHDRKTDEVKEGRKKHPPSAATAFTCGPKERFTVSARKNQSRIDNLSRGGASDIEAGHARPVARIVSRVKKEII